MATEPTDRSHSSTPLYWLFGWMILFGLALAIGGLPAVFLSVGAFVCAVQVLRTW